jgi:hypothetical protein
VVVAALASCSDGAAAPQPLSPPPTTPATTVASASPSRPAGNLEQSAEQFIRAYYQRFDRANRHSDPSLLRNLYDPNCRPCQYNLDVIERDDRRGVHVEGYEHELMKLSVGDLRGNTVAVTIDLRAKAGRVVRDHDGSLVQKLPATKPVRTDVILARTNSAWRIVNIVPLGEVKS